MTQRGPGVRVSGGELRGRVLAVPPGARPTEGRVREALFSIWGERIAGARFLDLFAGSGVVSLEAAGRGARAVLAVDGEPRAVQTLGANLRALDGEPAAARIEVRRLPLPAGLARLATREAGPCDRFDLAFADPPYAFADYAALLTAVAPLLAPEAEIAVEHSSRRELPETAGPLACCDVRRYGESSLSFYR